MDSSIILETPLLVIAAIAALLLGSYIRPILNWFSVAEAPFDTKNLDSIPAAMWIEVDNKVTWSNQAFKKLQEVVGEEIKSSSFLMKEVLSDANRQSRAKLQPANEKATLYFDVSVRHSNSSDFYTAMSAKEAVTAEKDRARFVQTLSEAFAHLPIGVAVFDKERDLSLFNPALTELLDVSPLWLAKKPSLRDFLDRLHDKGALPEPRNFKSWRDQIIAMEKSAETGTYFDDWHMPNNKVYRVTGRPHPKGAVAFVFEDISRSLAAEREYRMEIERLYAVLDSLDSGIIVFDSSGSLSFANDAFDEIWGTDYSKTLTTPMAGEVAMLWNEKCLPSPLLGEIRDFVAFTNERERWSGRLKTKSGQALEVHAVPMVSSFSLVEFSLYQDV